LIGGSAAGACQKQGNHHHRQRSFQIAKFQDAGHFISDNSKGQAIEAMGKSINYFIYLISQINGRS
jgi:hypothetical protein